VEDSISKALRLIVEDDRRKPDDEAAVTNHWRKEFARVHGEQLLEAVATWLRENTRGRPNVGKIWEILNRSTTTKTKGEEARDAYRRMELAWAVSILEAPAAFQAPHYRHTLAYAEKCLSYAGYTDWQVAKSFLEPGWAPSTVTEVLI